MGDLPGYGLVWYHKDDIANILSLYFVAEYLYVQYDNIVSNNFVAWRDDGSYRRVTPGQKGLYYCDMTNIVGTVLTNYCYNTVYNIMPENVNTVEENLK